ncbi:hypothetical protein Ciccas_012307, partial [Cichlidogyrus casuarinus]
MYLYSIAFAESGPIGALNPTLDYQSSVDGSCVTTTTTRAGTAKQPMPLHIVSRPGEKYGLHQTSTGAAQPSCLHPGTDGIHAPSRLQCPVVLSVARYKRCDIYEV